MRTFTRFISITLLLVAFAVVAAPFVLDFHFSGDDYEALRGASLDAFPVDGDFRVIKEGVYFRPIVTLSFALNGGLSSGQPWSYHLFNLLVHALNAVLVGILLVQLFETRGRLALFTGFVYFVLPQGVVNAYWIVGRTDLLYTTGILAASVAALSFVHTGRIRYIILMLAAFIGALLSKESGIVFLLYLAAFSSLFLLRGIDNRKRKRMLTVTALGLTIVATYILYRFAIFGSVLGATDAVAAGDTGRWLMWMLHGVASLIGPVDPVDFQALWHVWRPGAAMVFVLIVLYLSVFTLLFFRSVRTVRREVLLLSVFAFAALLLYLPNFPSTRLAYGILPLLLLPAVHLLDTHRRALRLRAVIAGSAFSIILLADAALIWKFHTIGAWNRHVERLTASLPDTGTVYVVAQFGRIGQTIAETAMPVWHPLRPDTDGRPSPEDREVRVLGRFEGSMFTDWRQPYTMRVKNDTLELLSQDEISGFVPVTEQKFSSLDDVAMNGFTLRPVAFAPKRAGVLRRLHAFPVKDEEASVIFHDNGKFHLTSMVKFRTRYTQAE